MVKILTLETLLTPAVATIYRIKTCVAIYLSSTNVKCSQGVKYTYTSLKNTICHTSIYIRLSIS